jgi:hypothetical protein
VGAHTESTKGAGYNKQPKCCSLHMPNHFTCAGPDAIRIKLGNHRVKVVRIELTVNVLSKSRAPYYPSGLLPDVLAAVPVRPTGTASWLVRAPVLVSGNERSLFSDGGTAWKAQGPIKP